MESSHTLPTGVVTFLLTDIEGSTRMWEREPETMHQALTRHDAIVHAGVRRMNGHVVKSKGEGDSVFAVFRHVSDAVTAAFALQSALAAEQWLTSTPIRVRMAVHTGQVDLRDGDYFGPTVNRCARLRALAKGGQVLLSGVTAQLTQSQLPSGASLQDLGTHQLKDLSAPERVWQLTHPQMAIAAAPNPRTAATAMPIRRAYKLTDHLNHSADGREWAAGVKHKATRQAIGDDDGLIRCYTTANLAVLLNPQYERFRQPKLWEALVDVVPIRGDAIVACQEVATTRQVALPTLTGLHHARFAVLCAREACGDSPREAEFRHWADTWLGGEDSSGVKARALAAELESAVHDHTALAHPELSMAANAARAAAHASKLGWLAGRARDEENSRAIEFATEAIHMALRMTRLDLPALADEAVPKVASPVAPVRPTSTVTPTRILRALPT